MKVVTIYSPSHKQMVDEFFLPSFPKDDRLNLKLIEVPQTAGETPAFNSPEWSEFMKIKAKIMWEELQSTPENEFYLFLDTDIITVNNFCDYLAVEMSTWDLICQSDSPFPHIINHCTGIVCVKNNEKTRNLFKAISMIMDGHILIKGQPKFVNEQEIMTWLLINKQHIFELRDIQNINFPFTVAYTYGSIAGKVWDGQDVNFVLPSKDKLMWVHANWTKHEDKIPLLKLFKEKLQ
jgi:hypothetical protein